MCEMKGSGIEWIGLTPSMWANRRIKYVIKSRDSGLWGQDVKCKENGTICLRIADFDYSKGIFKDTPVDALTYRKYPSYVVDKCHLKKGDILIEKSGGGEKTPVGRTVLFDKPYIALFANFMDRIRVNTSVVMPQYLQYWFRAFYSCKMSPYYINQTTGIQNINLSRLLTKEKVFYPSLKDQKAIVSFLDIKCSEIDAISADIQKEIETLEQYKRSIITEAVTKGLNPDAEMKDSGIEWVGNIPVHWDTIPIRYLFAECRLKNILNQEKTALKFTYGTIIKKTNFDSDSDEYVANTMTNYTVVYPGTIMINGLNLNYDFVSQRVGLVKDRGAITSAYLAIVPGSRVVSEYANYQLKSWDYAKAFHNMGTGVRKTLDFSELGKKYFVTPSIEEQSKIVAFLDSKCKEIEAIIASKKQQLTVIDSYKKSLIYEYVTGKKEVI